MNGWLRESMRKVDARSKCELGGCGDGGITPAQGSCLRAGEMNGRMR